MLKMPVGDAEAGLIQTHTGLAGLQWRGSAKDASRNSQGCAQLLHRTVKGRLQCISRDRFGQEREVERENRVLENDVFSTSKVPPGPGSKFRYAARKIVGAVLARRPKELDAAVRTPLVI